MIKQSVKASLLLLIGIIISFAQETINNMPAAYKASIEWVYNQRISPKSSSAPIGEGSLVRKNVIFDQIYAENGQLFYVGKWQSSQKLTLANRQALEKTVYTKINNWAKLLIGYDGWPYKDIPVKIVGWAVADASVIVDKQASEIVYTTYETDPISKDDANVPAKLPYAPSTCSRFDHFTDTKYTYSACPGGAQNHFDMYLWATTSWNGAVGGDWGQRMSESAWLSNSMMIDHEMGHGFGITDFYQASERPADMESGKIKTIMWAGNSNTITDWDKWMLRYMWTQLKKDASRFPARTPVANVYTPVAYTNAATKISVCKSTIQINLNTSNADNIAIQLFDMKGARINASVSILNPSTIVLDNTSNRLKNGHYIVKLNGTTINEVHSVNILN